MKTFSKKGLTKLQIAFLTHCEKEFFKGTALNKELMYRYANENGCNGDEKGTQILEAWEYWAFLPKPLIRETLNTPVQLQELFWSLQGTKEGFYITGATVDRVRPKDKLMQLIERISLIYDFEPTEFYFEIVKGNLWLKYNKIIGQRFIACINDDLNKFEGEHKPSFQKAVKKEAKRIKKFGLGI